MTRLLKILLFSNLTFAYNSNAGESKPSKLIFLNLVDSTAKLLGDTLRTVQRYRLVWSLFGLTCLAMLLAGCSVNRVTLRTRLNGYPVEVEFNGNHNSDCPTFGATFGKE